MFAYLVFCHFVFDWIFQSEQSAGMKSRNWRLRLRHCVAYTNMMILAIYFLGATNHLASTYVWLIATHFIEDTYIPVVLWAKYIRKMEEFKDTSMTNGESGTEALKKPINLILFIVVDQIIHVACLLPVVLVK